MVSYGTDKCSQKQLWDDLLLEVIWNNSHKPKIKPLINNHGIKISKGNYNVYL